MSALSSGLAASDHAAAFIKTLDHAAAVLNASSSAGFFQMGGYAAYVWPAYAVFCIVLIADTIAPRLRRRRVLRELRARLVRQQARQNPTGSHAIPTPPSP